MSEIERRLAEALGEHAHSAVPDRSPVPPPAFGHDGRRASRPTGRSTGRSTARRPVRHRPARRRVARVLAPLAVAAAVAGVAVGVALHASSTAGHPVQAAGGPTTSPAPVVSSTAPTPTTPVHVAFGLSDGTQVGVGMPVVAYFSKPITDGRALQTATNVEVNGVPAQADWYFESTADVPGYAMQAHLRMAKYWPAHSTIVVNLPVAGLTAGSGLAYDDSPTLHFQTGAATLATVSDVSHKLTVTKDGRTVGTYPVSLGAAQTPTLHGIKVIMSKGASICMTGPGYSECGIKYTQRLTASGEYLHAAPWNVKNIDAGIDSSNGCTNLTTNDARKLYSVMEVGDVVAYPNADGSAMSATDGYGDWNVPWAQWLTGGAVRTR